MFPKGIVAVQGRWLDKLMRGETGWTYNSVSSLGLIDMMKAS